MKLYLSSYRIPTPDDLTKLLDKAPAQTKIAVIPNAQDYYAERARRIKIRDVSDYLKTLGYVDSTTVDLRDYNESQDLKNELQQYDLIWVMGGNTFCLSYEIRRSGFNKVIKDVLDNGVVYGGESAGAIMAGNSLKSIEFADPSEFAEEVVWETLNLTPHFILPHTDNPNFASAIQKAKARHRNNSTLIELNDNQVYVLNELKTEIKTKHE